MLLILELMKLSNLQSQTPRLAILHRATALVLDRRIILATNALIVRPTATQPTVVVEAVVTWSIPIILALPRAIISTTRVVSVVTSRRRPVSVFLAIIPARPILSVLVGQAPPPALAVRGLVVVRRRIGIVTAWALRTLTLVNLCC